MKVRVLLVDDHPVVRSGMRALLESQDDFEVVGEAGDGAQALLAVVADPPDVVLLDLRMPVLDGVGVIERLRETHPDVRALVLTTYDADRDIFRAVEAGATGYLLKDTPREELFRAVRAAARGEPVLAPAVAARLMRRAGGPPAPTPTERELDVLRLVAQGLTNRAIARRLRVSEATVKTHLVHVFGKLGVDDRTAAVTAALERGLLRL